MRRGFLLNKSLSDEGKSGRQPVSSASKPLNKETERGVHGEAREPRATAEVARVPIPAIHIPAIPHHELIAAALTLGTQITLHVVHLPLPPSDLAYAEHTTTCILLSGQAPQILASPGFPRDPARPRHAHLYDIRPVPALPAPEQINTEVELGLFATSSLEPGDLILSERPLLLTLRALPAGSAPGTSADDILERAAEAMPARERRAFLALRNCKTHGDPRLSRARGIVATNALGIGSLPGHAGDCAVVCERTCRANHSCSPNAVARWDLPSFSVELRARRPVRAGEELTISYLPDLTLPRAARVDLLRASYAFTCACTACALSGAARTRSDARRALLARQRSLGYDDARFAGWLREGAGERVVAACESVMALIDEEGCVEDGVWAVGLHWLCRAYCALGRDEEARACARRATGLARAFTGGDGGWARVAEDPRMTEN
ncbi:uncharacterized protein B0H18DRAFT_35759 [Fomitopsis serialis]|uniref:uncharacterized protein n=1 Tax=Fomitopsis serialis TaxID=139415 RepID=UPI0020085844|nr:uncharacterized protein B0H18DRAFT_35759 [Neoantrodia serialis]KAH9917518.1 hypothetical protein B0H18DRAFT_35759 [Neoantrodia serialis]